MKRWPALCPACLNRDVDVQSGAELVQVLPSSRCRAERDAQRLRVWMLMVVDVGLHCHAMPIACFCLHHGLLSARVLKSTPQSCAFRCPRHPPARGACGATPILTYFQFWPFQITGPHLFPKFGLLHLLFQFCGISGWLSFLVCGKVDPRVCSFWFPVGAWGGGPYLWCCYFRDLP